MPSPFTVGVEEEYQLVDPKTGTLRSRARDILALDWSDDIRKEMQQSTVEIGTAPRGCSSELIPELRRLRFQAATAAAAEGLAVVAAGLHPFSRWEDQQLMPGDRYRRIAERYGRIAAEEHKFGMHIHVAVPDPALRFRIFNQVRCYLPHILALASSSPFFEGDDTGYDSFRTVLWRRWPLSGVPPCFQSLEEYRGFMDLLLDADAIEDERNVYWSLRPHPEYPTLEFRGADVCPRMDDAVAVAGFVRLLVVASAEGVLEPRVASVHPRELRDPLLSLNEWRVARDGLNATLVDPENPAGGRPMREALEGLLQDLAAVAGSYDEASALAGVREILARGTGAARMREAYRSCGGLRGLVDWLAAETLVGTGMDRRSGQRDACV